MPFHYILANLIANNEGSVGALFLDPTGETIDLACTEITPYQAFYKAEDYHQGYYDANPRAGYCRVDIAPKLEKLEKVFADRLKR